jgi:hypothetical protein
VIIQRRDPSVQTDAQAEPARTSSWGVGIDPEAIDPSLAV